MLNTLYFFLFICGRPKRLSCEQCVGSCAPVAVCRSISNGDQQLCIKLDDQY